jgi:integrase
MALIMKLPHITTDRGKLKYQRRIRKDAANLIPQKLFKVTLREQSQGAALVSEHAALEAAYERLHQDALEGHSEAHGKQAVQRYVQSAYDGLDDPRTDREKWESFKTEAEELVRSVKGLSGHYSLGDGGDSERREVVADELERTGAPSLLYRAVVAPNSDAPPATLADAANVYAKEKLGDKPSKSARNTFNKIKRRLETSLGPLDRMALVDLRREHAKKVRDDLLKAPKKGGGTLSVASVEREINSIKAMISVGIEEHDLRGKAFNPFEKLSMPASVSRDPQSEWELRDPFPDNVLIAARQQVMTRVRIPELRLIWRLLQATGCRGAEITGLRTEDVVIDHPTPHIWVRWHEDRQVKTKTSIRPIPLVGDGLEAAKEAVELAEESDALFYRYSREGGPDAVSGALMSHVRKITDNPRYVVYSLRHNLKSWLGKAEVSERDENRILGHADSAVGNRFYGGLEERLATTTKALEEALGRAPDGAWMT